VPISLSLEEQGSEENEKFVITEKKTTTNAHFYVILSLAFPSS
jgi:hypothetical protein